MAANDLLVTIDASTEGLRRQLNSADAAVAKFDRTTKASLGQIDSTMRKVDQSFNSLNKGATGFSKFGGAAQQAGYQIGDFATQIAGGQNALVALTQQLGQLLGAFGTAGAVIGAAASIAGALAIKFVDTRGASEKFKDGLKGLEAQIEASNALLKETESGLTAVADAFARADEFQQALIRSNLEESIRKGSNAIRDQAKAIKELTGAQELFGTISGPGGRPSTAIGVIRPAEGLSKDQAFGVSEAMRAFEQSDGGLEAAKAFAQAIINLRGELNGASPAFTEFADQVLVAIEESVKGGKALEALKRQLSVLGQEIAPNAVAFRILAERISEAEKASAKLRAQARGIVADYNPVTAATRVAVDKLLALRKAFDAGDISAEAYRTSVAGITAEQQRALDPLGATLTALQAEADILKKSEEDRKRATRVQTEYTEAVKKGAPATEATRKAIEKQVDAIVAQEKANAAAKKAQDELQQGREKEKRDRETLSTQRKQTVVELQSEAKYLADLVVAQGQGEEAVYRVERARKAELEVQRLKLENNPTEKQQIEDLVGANEDHKRAIDKIKDAQKEAEKAAEKTLAAQKKAAEEAQREYEKLVDSIANVSQEKLGDALFDALKGETLDFAEFLKDTLLRAIADIAAAALTRQIVIPIAAQVIGAAPGLFGLSGGAAQVAQSAGGLGGAGNLLGAGNSLYSIFGGGASSLASSFAMSGVGAGLGLSVSAPALAANTLALSGPLGGAATGALAAQQAAVGGVVGSGGLTAAGSALAAAAPYIAAAVAAGALLFGSGMFGPNPSVGPTGVARLPGVIGRSEFELTTDNGGNTDQVEAIGKQIRDVSTAASEALDAFGSRAFGLDIGGFSSPQKGSGQKAGFNLKEILDGVLASQDFAKGLTAEEAVTEGVRKTLQKAFDGFAQSEVSTALQKSAAKTVEELLKDLDFANVLGVFADGGMDAVKELQKPLTAVEQAFKDLTKAADEGKDKARELGLSVQVATDYFAALRTELVEQTQESFTRQLREARGEGIFNVIDDLLDTRSTNARSAQAAGLDINANAGGLFDAQLRNALGNAGLADLQRVLAETTDAQSQGIIRALINERALTAAREQEALAMVDQIAGMQELAEQTERFAAAANDNARTLRQAAQGLLVDPNLSPLSPELRLQEARRQFESAFGLANDNDPTDDLSQDAIQRLPGLSQTMLEASKAYYGSTEGYLEDFTRAQDYLNNTALRQESIEQQQLSALRDIEAAILSAGGVTGTPSQQAAASGFNFGSNPANRSIYDALVAAGLPTPSGFGAGQANELRQQNPAVDALLRSMGFASGGSFTVAGPAGNDNLLMPLRLTAGEAVNVHRGDTMQAVVGELRALRTQSAEQIQINRALLHENAQLRQQNARWAQADMKAASRLADRQAAQPRRAYG